MKRTDLRTSVVRRIRGVRWQTVELLLRISVRPPVIREVTEIVVEGAVLLQHENNMLNRLQRGIKDCCHGTVTLYGEGARSVAATYSVPVSKHRSALTIRNGGEGHRSTVREAAAATLAARYSGGIAGHGAGAGTRYGYGELGSC